MYITEVLTKTKSGKLSHTCVLLRESYREDGKVKNRTIANLTNSDPKDIEAIKFALKNKSKMSKLENVPGLIDLKQGQSVGSIYLLFQLAKSIGIEKALGNSVDGKLALWQVISRVIGARSRLSSVRLASSFASCDVLNITETFDEDRLYSNLSWLADNQERIENSLYEGRETDLFLYDVTSSYMEGENNAYAEYGYNRDKKSGKMQIVLGLLTDSDGVPVSIEVFSGSTRDFDTVESQINKAKERFNCKRVTFVGDRGMIKGPQIELLSGVGFSYITAITKPQIKKMINEGVFQLELFSESLCEIENEGVRYVLRKNSHRAEEMKETREQKLNYLMELVSRSNKYLSEHSKAKLDTQIKGISEKITKLKLNDWVSLEITGRVLELKTDTEKLSEISKFDGCYVLKTDLPKDVSKETIHKRYKDLYQVEEAFKLSKTEFLEMRPWYVCTEESTKGHALVVMLSYLLIKELKKLWAEINMTVEEGINELSLISVIEAKILGGGVCNTIPAPGKKAKALLKAANVTLPEVLPNLGINVVSRKSLAESRK
jgi:transposase